MPPLSPRLNKLDKRLAALPKTCEPMLLSELDGFVAGLVVCPDTLAPSEWLPLIWNAADEDDDAVAFDSEDELSQFVGLVMQHYNAVSRNLHRGPGRYDPIYEVGTRDDEIMWEFWVEGFVLAIALSPDSWLRIFDSDDEEAVAAMSMMATLAAIARDESELPQEKVDELTDLAPAIIPRCMNTLHAWRVQQDLANAPPVRAPHAKVGRNDPCPCGSGRKYKKCCGRN